MSELSDVEQLACIDAGDDFLWARTLNTDLRDAFDAGWLAARDYYKAEQQAERERRLEKPKPGRRSLADGYFPCEECGAMSGHHSRCSFYRDP